MSGELVQINGQTGEIIKAGETHRQEFGAVERKQSAELAAASQAATARALVEARYVMALQRPSDFFAVRSRLLKDCERSSFAEIAWYAKPVAGGKVEGPSIRFAEAYVRARGNIDIETSIIHEDDSRRLLRVSVIDLETNVASTAVVGIEKTTERRNADGREVLKTRKNSKNEVVYVVAATEDEMLTKQNALASKARRTLIISLIPGDLLEEAKATVFGVRKKGAAEDPDAAKRKLIDAFEFRAGIRPAMLAEYLGHALDTTTPDEILELQGVLAAIESGEAKWAEVMADRARPTAPPASGGTKAQVLAAAQAVTGSAPAVLQDARDGADDDAPSPFMEEVDALKATLAGYVGEKQMATYWLNEVGSAKGKNTPQSKASYLARAQAVVAKYMPAQRAEREPGSEG